MTTLLAVAFPYATTAAAAAQDMLLLDPDIAVEPDSIALVTCDARGNFQVITYHRPVPGESRGLFWTLLFTALLFVPLSPVMNVPRQHDLSRRVEEAGIPDTFQVWVREELRPDTSTLFLLVAEPFSTEAMESVGRFGGKVLATGLTADAETLILRALCPSGRLGPVPLGDGGAIHGG